MASLLDIQYKTNPTIFSRKKLALAAQTYRLDNIEGIQTKKQKLAGWIKGIKDGSITSKKEEAIDHDFLNLFFGEILDYEYKQGEEILNLEKQLKNQTDSKKADGSLGYFDYKTKEKTVRAVIELKDGQTDLDKPQNRKNDHRTPVQQAFDYASDAGGTCNWVIVSNFVEIRLYNYRDRGKYELFYITEFLENELELKRFFYLLYKDRLIDRKESVVDRLYAERLAEEKVITNNFYQEFKSLRLELYQSLKVLNPAIEPLILLNKTQKILDRIIFICFCEDAIPELIPGTTIHKMIAFSKGQIFTDYPDYLWTNTKGLFNSMDTGNLKANIAQFNGGLFAKDAYIERLIVDEKILEKALNLYLWDFESQLNVNILGHIFEQSIGDLEVLQKEVENTPSQNTEITARKKEGVFYTPPYITSYIIEETIGTWIFEQKLELNFDNLEALEPQDYADLDKFEKQKPEKKIKLENKVKPHRDFWLAFKYRLDKVTVLDPACGSGAFLVQAFDYLYKQQIIVQTEIQKLRLDKLLPAVRQDWWEVQKNILTHNLYGVDLNFESVEITKLSLWIKTANRKKKLSFIDKNIICGNSLISDSSIAGEKALDWNKAFKDIIADGGFDIVVGNPPYVSTKIIPSIHKDYFIKTYASARGQFDLYGIFIEKGLSLIKNNGYLSYITSNTFLSNKDFQSLRKILLTTTSIIEIANLGETVFEDANLDVAIAIFKKQRIENHKIKIIKSRTEFDNKVSNYILQNRFDIEKNNFEIKLNSNESEIELIDKIFENKETLDNILKLPRGIEIGGDSTFISDIPKEGFKKLLVGRNIDRYTIDFDKKFIEFQNDKSVFKDIVIYESPKILIQRIRNLSLKRRIIATLDKENYLCTNTLRIGLINNENYDLRYVLAILNSTIINFIFSKYFLNKDIYAYQLERIPISKLTLASQIPFIQKADEMLRLNFNFATESSFFLKIFTAKYKIEKLSTKLEKWFESDFHQFEKELKKQKIEIPIKETRQWIELFEESQAKVKTIQAQITQTDAEIDTMVYQLYELTDDEIKAVEGR